MIFSEAVDGIDAHCVHGYVIHDVDSGSKVDLSYPRDDNGSVMTGRSFHHGRFVMGLRKLAQAEPKSVFQTVSLHNPSTCIYCIALLVYNEIFK